MKFERVVLGAAMFALLAGAADASTLYSQPWDGTGSVNASQNDTTLGGFGNFATAFDDFTLASAANINGVEFVGQYFNPATQSPITAFTLTFYNDNAGIPGNAIATGFFAGNAGETSLGGTNYDYSLAFLNFFVNAGTYWMSVVPDLAFPPQWGLDTSSVGTDNAYQTFFGSSQSTGVNLAFSVLGTPQNVPEPITLSLFGAGLAGAVAMRRRKKKAV